jgi:hypothetical protein
LAGGEGRKLKGKQGFVIHTLLIHTLSIRAPVIRTPVHLQQGNTSLPSGGINAED